MGDRYIGEQLTTADIQGLIDPATGDLLGGTSTATGSTVSLNVAAFNGALSSADTTAQTMADTLDDKVGQSVGPTASPSHVALTLTQTTGTKPLTISSTTLNDNLNADMVDGFHASQTAGASKIAVAGAAGTLADGYIAEGTATTGMVPTKQADGSKIWQTPQGSTGGSGVGRISSSELSFANGQTRYLSVGACTQKFPSWVMVQYAGQSNVVDSSWDMDAADEANYTQQNSAKTRFTSSGLFTLEPAVTDSTVAVWIPGNGGNGSQLIQDVVSNRTLTIAGNTAITTTSPKYGSGSVDFPATGDYIHFSVTDLLSTNWQNHSWVAECFLNADTLVGNNCIISSQNSGRSAGIVAWLVQTQGTNVIFFASNNGSSHNISNGDSLATGISTGTWYHVAVVYDATDTSINVYWEGTRVRRYTPVTAFAASQQYVNMGEWISAGGHFDGKIDNFRLSVDSASNAPRYTGASLTIPAAEFTTHSFDTTAAGWYGRPSSAMLLLPGVSQIDSLTITQQEPTGTSIRWLYTVDGGVTYKNHSDATVALADIMTSGSTKAQIEAKFTPYTPAGADTQWWLVWAEATTDATITPTVSLISFQWDGTSTWRQEHTNAAETSQWQIDSVPHATGAFVAAKRVSGGTVTAVIQADIAT